MAEESKAESESGKWAKLQRHLRRVKRLKRLHAWVHERLEEEIEALERVIHKHMQSFRK